MLEPLALDRTEVVAVAEFDEQLLLDRPVPVAKGCSILSLEMLLDVEPDAVVVEQRVVHVDQEDDRVSVRSHDARTSFRVWHFGGPQGGTRD